MSTPNDGGPAFPRPGYSGKDGKSRGDQEGMSKREFIAAEALTGLLANPDGNRSFGPIDWARAAVEAADALLAELAKGQS